jgi:hypothetical protein
MTPTQAKTEPSTIPAGDVRANGESPLSYKACRLIFTALQAETAEALAAFEAAKEQARRRVLERHGIDANQLARIEARADLEGWPPWDGLADDRGPIPTFGPMKKDRNGRPTRRSPEEEEAQRDAAIRMLDVIGKITDESDTDEIWDRFDRNLEESRRRD